MRLSTLAAAITGVAALSSSALAGFTFLAERNNAVSGSPVDVYALNDGAGGTGNALAAIQLQYVGTPVQFFFDEDAAEVSIPAGTGNTSWLRVGSAANTFVVGNDLRIAGTPAPTTDTRWQSPVGDFRAALAFQSAAAPATAAVNGGRGVRVARFFLPADGSFTLTNPAGGGVAGNSGPILPFSVSFGGTVANVAPAFVGSSPYELVFDFGNNDVASASITISATDADSADVVSILSSALPSVLSGLTVSSTPGNPGSITIGGTLTNPSAFNLLTGETFAIGLTAADNNATSADATATLNIRVIPEPATLGLLAGAGLLALRRRK